MKLEGTLATFPLRELIEMVVYSSVTGALNIYGPGAHGRLYFRDGHLIHIERGPATGVEALAELLELAEATFAFVSGVVTDQESLWGSLSHNLQSAERLVARWRHLRPYVPHLDLVPILTLAREAAMRRTSPAHHPLVSAVDGQTSLRQLAPELGWAEVDVAEAIVQLTVDGLVELRSQRPGGAAEPHAAPPSEGGLFDRLLARGPHGLPATHARNVETRSPEELILRLLRG